MAARGIEVRDIYRVSKSGARTKSYRIVIPKENLDDVLNNKRSYFESPIDVRVWERRSRENVNVRKQ